MVHFLVTWNFLDKLHQNKLGKFSKLPFFCVLLSTDRLGTSLVDENSNHASRVGKVSLSKESFTTVSNFYVWLFGAGELVVCPMKYKSVQREQSDVELQLDATDFKLQLWQETLSYQWVATYKSYNPQTRILDLNKVIHMN